MMAPGAIMIPDKVKQVLNTRNLTAIEFEEGSTPTSETAAAKLDVTVSQIAKSLLFQSETRLRGRNLHRNRIPRGRG